MLLKLFGIVRYRLVCSLVNCAVIALCFCQCQRNDTEPFARIALEVWIHSGQASERRTLEAQVAEFEKQNLDIDISLTTLPEGAYDKQIQAAALANKMPDILEFDGPYVYNYIWQNKLVPLDGLLTKEIKQDLIPSITAQGTLNGRLYAVGTFDSGLGLYALKNKLKKTGIRIPTSLKDPWTIAEFNDVLKKLAEAQPQNKEHVIDLKANQHGEWIPYAFSPVLQSAGADLINRNTGQALGILDSPQAVSALSHLQMWYQKGWVDPNVDTRAFVSGRVPISWSGHWDYQSYAKYADEIGDELLVLPLPNFGNGSVTGQGSWNWGVTIACQNKVAAGRFLSFLLETKNVLKITYANGAVPGTRSALNNSKLYGHNGPLSIFATGLNQKGATVPRPKTAAYPMISAIFQKAYRDIRDGMDVGETLHRAAVTLDKDRVDNNNYQLEPTSQKNSNIFERE